MNTTTKYIITVAFFIGIFLSGFWLSSTGRPLNTIIFTIHKFIALGAVVFLGYTLFQVNRGSALTATQIIFSVSTGLFFVATMITGGLLSIDKIMPSYVLLLHQVLPVLTTLSSAASLYILIGRK